MWGGRVGERAAAAGERDYGRDGVAVDRDGNDWDYGAVFGYGERDGDVCDDGDVVGGGAVGMDGECGVGG
jgi:hypothetical protein